MSGERGGWVPLAGLLVLGLGMLWQAWVVRDLRAQVARADARIAAIELEVERVKARGAVSVVDLVDKWSKRRERKAKAAAGDVDTHVPLTPRDAETEAWLEELEVQLEGFGADHEVPPDTLAAVHAAYASLRDELRAARDHLAAGHLTHAQAREQIEGAREASEARLKALLGEDLAYAVRGYVPADPGAGARER